MNRRNSDLQDAVRRSLERYFRDLDGEKPTAIHDMVMRNVEKPMIELVLSETEGNLTQAATMLGINRNTLRKKMQDLRIKH
jgi:Fis family transcriptional regulator